jgi:two-component system, OmpR family, phosphate regulon response regulator PhoB
VGEVGQTKPLVLVGTEDIDFYLFVDHLLQAENLATQLAGSLDEIQKSALEMKPDAILLDCRGRAQLAAQICTPLKQNSQTKAIPVVALIDQSAERYYVELIKSGIDDIFIRPILPSKLIECVRSVLPSDTAANGTAEHSARAVRYADVEMDLVTYRVRRDGRDVHLSPIEFKLLRHFLERPEQVITREELHSAAWLDNVHVGPRTVDVHVGRLRKALHSGSKGGLIRTVRSVGYALSVHTLDDPAPDM